MSNSCIILDLDHTIIQTVHTDKDNYQNQIVTLDWSDCKYNLYLRNHLDVFLEFCFSKYQHVVLWTAATDNYVEMILPYLPLQGKQFYRIITRDLFDCTTKNLDWFLTDPDISANKTWFIDDIPSRIKGLPEENIIVAPKFDVHKNPTDQYLLNLIEILKII